MTTDDALYQPLPHLDRDIRLIAILPAPNGDINDPVECTIRPVNPKDPETSFHALSYTWGDPGVTIPITLNGVSVNVTTNLDSALRHLRAKYSVEIWIDALSINQKDPKEKKKQIPLMGDIYSLAAHVIVWLGPEDDDAGAAMEHIENWYAALDKHRISDTADKFDMFSVVEELEDPFDEDKFAAVTSLLKRPWWFRKWIIQEVFMAKEITLLIGMHVFSWHHFKTVVTCWDDDDLKSSGAAPWNFFRIRGDDFTVFGTLEALCHLKNTNGLTQDFLEVAKLHQSSLCGDPRDRIYALMSLASDASDLIIPSSTPNPHASSVFTGFAAAHIKHYNRLGILEHALPLFHPRLRRRLHNLAKHQLQQPRCVGRRRRHRQFRNRNRRTSQNLAFGGIGRTSALHRVAFDKRRNTLG